MVMANGFNELNVNEMMEVDGGFGILMTIGAYLGLSLLALPLAVAPVNAAMEAYDKSLEDERDRGMKDAVNDARTDFANGFRE